MATGKWIHLQCIWDLLGEFDYGLCFPSACRFIPWWSTSGSWNHFWVISYPHWKLMEI